MPVFAAASEPVTAKTAVPKYRRRGGGRGRSSGSEAGRWRRARAARGAAWTSRGGPGAPGARRVARVGGGDEALRGAGEAPGGVRARVRGARASDARAERGGRTAPRGRARWRARTRGEGRRGRPEREAREGGERGGARGVGAGAGAGGRQRRGDVEERATAHRPSGAPRDRFAREIAGAGNREPRKRRARRLARDPENDGSNAQSAVNHQSLRRFRDPR